MKLGKALFERTHANISCLPSKTWALGRALDCRPETKIMWFPLCQSNHGRTVPYRIPMRSFPFFLSFFYCIFWHEKRIKLLKTKSMHVMCHKSKSLWNVCSQRKDSVYNRGFWEANILQSKLKRQTDQMDNGTECLGGQSGFINVTRTILFNCIFGIPLGCIPSKLILNIIIIICWFDRSYHVIVFQYCCTIIVRMMLFTHLCLPLAHPSQILAIRSNELNKIKRRKLTKNMLITPPQ